MNATLKNVLNVTWKVGLGLVGLLALGIGIFVAVICCEERYGRDYYNDKQLSASVRVEAYNDGRERVKSLKTCKYTTPKLKWVSGTPLRDSLTVFCDMDGRRGFLNVNTGEIVLKAKYPYAWQFSEGLAFVVLPGEDSLSVIDHGGKVVLRNVAKYRRGDEYVFSDGLCEIEWGCIHGLLRSDGTWALEMRYFEIQTQNTEGYRIARDEAGFWLFDSSLRKVFDEPFESLDYAIGRDLGTGNLYAARNHVKQLLNYDGTVVAPFVIDGTYDLKYMVKYNAEEADEYEVSPDVAVYCVDSWEGLLDKRTGRVLTPAVYTNFTMISPNLISAELSFNGEDQAVLMDRYGRVIRQ